MIKSMKVAALMVSLVCLIAAMPALAQDKGCQPVRLLLQASLNIPAEVPPPAPPPGVVAWGWAGHVRGFLGTEPINGVLFYLPSTESTTPHGQTGHEPSNRAVFAFDTVGTFVTVADGAVFQMSPGISPHMVYPPDLGWGHYSATVKVAPDSDPLLTSGRFIDATGNLSISGMFLVNVPPPALADIGIWNAEITGKLCNVAPHP